jgi:hypothetical protein
MERDAFNPSMNTFFRKHYQKTKVAIVSHVNFNFEI